MPQTPTDSTPGLRERKKAQTRDAIQTHALNLFARQGYAATTVEQIIRGVDVSESTFFRYFPTKESLVLTDDFDPVILGAFAAQPPDVGVMDALRIAFRALFDALTDEQLSAQRERLELVLGVPALRAAIFEQFSTTMDLLAEAIAQRLSRDPGDFEVRTAAGAVIGASMAVLAALTEDAGADYGQLMDDAMAQLQAGVRF
ncbi:MAG TPA: TetR family transcriptional regulator [Galbitalea sp.]|nr:TetR family transcriptional regulator [Galbitalea sp.]